MAVDKINPAAAANAYSNLKGVGQGAGLGSGDKNVSFGDILKTAAQSGVETIRHGEEVSAQAITGKADLTDVVQAINDAEMTLQTVVAVRDRMVSAYQEIMRMPI